VTHAARTAHVDQKGGTGRTGRARVPRARVGRGSAVSGGVPSGGENGREHGGNAWGRPLPDCLNGTPPARLTTFCLLHTSRRPSAVFYWSRVRGWLWDGASTLFPAPSLSSFHPPLRSGLEHASSQRLLLSSRIPFSRAHSGSTCGLQSAAITVRARSHAFNTHVCSSPLQPPHNCARQFWRVFVGSRSLTPVHGLSPSA
jgi:hypothetical protein